MCNLPCLITIKLGFIGGLQLLHIVFPTFQVSGVGVSAFIALNGKVFMLLMLLQLLQVLECQPASWAERQLACQQHRNMPCTPL